MVKKSGSADQLIAVILKGIEEVKGKDIDILDLREIENIGLRLFHYMQGFL